MASLWIVQQVAIIVCLSGLLVIALSNMGILRWLGHYPPPPRTPRVSIMVPARNEEQNIIPCMQSLLAQDYPNFEIIALNDHSTDRTGEILAEMAAGDSRLRVLTGRPLPPHWMGKNWACYQLARAAQGELLLFTDADTRHDPRTVTDAVAALYAMDADLLSAMPYQECATWAEKLAVPALLWGSFSFLPLALAYRVRTPEISTTLGQCMLFRRQAYERVGGYKAVRSEVLDDTALGRRIKAHGLRWRLIDGTTRIRCRMYHGLREVFAGFSKNIFPMFDYNLGLYVLVWLWIAIAFLEPLVVLLLHWAGTPVNYTSLTLAGASVAFTLVIWTLSCWRFNLPFYLAPLYPVTVMMAIAIGISSAVQALAGRARWKGRRLAKPKIRLW